MAKQITVFTRDDCAYCVTVKKWLTIKGVQYSEVNLDKNPELHQEIISKSGTMTVPVTLVTKEDDAEEFVVGPNFARLASLAV